jgi:hypothetical protein
VRAGTVPTFHVIADSETVAVPEPGVASEKLIPSAAGRLTTAPARSVQP